MGPNKSSEAEFLIWKMRPQSCHSRIARAHIEFTENTGFCPQNQRGNIRPYLYFFSASPLRGTQAAYGDGLLRFSAARRHSVHLEVETPWKCVPALRGVIEGAPSSKRTCSEALWRMVNRVFDVIPWRFGDDSSCCRADAVWLRRQSYSLPDFRAHMRVRVIL